VSGPPDPGAAGGARPAAAGWDPHQYLAFAGPRLRPALDLLGRLDLRSPRTVFDLGCGPGQVTRLLAARWPAAHVTGVDGSAAMLEAARREPSPVTWVEADLRAWRPAEPADLLFSNAALHWLDGHAALFPRLAGSLAPGGILAVQMPLNHQAPSHLAVEETVHTGPWRARLAPILRRRPVAEPAAYLDWLAPTVASVDLWVTEYLHVLEGEDPVVEWVKGSALKPLLDALAPPERAAFLADYSARVARAYPRRPDGRTLLPFRRLFLVARR
jgi:trans-aconitate 2-methyltransferase